MPIDLAEYTRGTLKYIKQRSLACVYVIAYRGGKPCKIGYAQDIGTRYSTIQSSNAHDLFIDHIVWTPSPGIAQLIEKYVHNELHDFNLRGEWFDVMSETAASAIDNVAKNICRNGKTLSHSELMAALKAGGITAKPDERRRFCV